MWKTLLFVIVLSGPSAVSKSTRKEYHYVSMSKTWADAQSYCRETFTDLATVENQDDNSKLLGVIQSHEKFAWIGLYDDLNIWKWSLEDANFNTREYYRNWKLWEPDNKNGMENCTVVSESGRWYDVPCMSEHPSVCFNKRGLSKYILVETKQTWNQARQYCRSNYTDLASVMNSFDNYMINQLLSENSWIGLHRHKWASWSDGKPTTFTNWNESQPDNSGKSMSSCAVVNTTTGTWWDVNCWDEHYFICQKVHPIPERKTTFKLKFQSEADLTDPAVQQQILEQLHANLEKHGLPDFKLRWIQTDEQAFHKEQKRKKEKGIPLAFY
ncbi:macrophage mannose receptor 1-like [Lates japonicus]